MVLSVEPLLTSRTVWLMSATATPAAAAVPSLKLHQNLEWAERETMRRALEQARGVKKDAAELMGISQRALESLPRQIPHRFVSYGSRKYLR